MVHKHIGIAIAHFNLGRRRHSRFNSRDHAWQTCRNFRMGMNDLVDRLSIEAHLDQAGRTGGDECEII
jgi:hypothetical protein